jgi:hypothetical protein
MMLVHTLASPTSRIRSVSWLFGLRTRWEMMFVSRRYAIDPSQLGVVGRELRNRREILFAWREPSEHAEQRSPRCRLDHQSLTLPVHDGLVTRQLELTRDAHGLIAAASEKSNESDGIILARASPATQAGRCPAPRKGLCPSTPRQRRVSSLRSAAQSPLRVTPRDEVAARFA